MTKTAIETLVRSICPNDHGEIMHAIEQYSMSQKVVTEAMMKRALLVGGTPSRLASLLTTELQNRKEASPKRLLRAV